MDSFHDILVCCNGYPNIKPHRLTYLITCCLKNMNLLFTNSVLFIWKYDTYFHKSEEILNDVLWFTEFISSRGIFMSDSG